MKVTFISREERLARSDAGEFYLCTEPLEEPRGSELRMSSIEALRDFVGEDESVFVSDFVNTPRLLFIDLELPGLKWEVIERIREWVRMDEHDHAVLVGLLLTPGQEEYDSFLVTKEWLLFDEIFLDLPWLVQAVMKFNDGSKVRPPTRTP
jgi:hypothetical protein